MLMRPFLEEEVKLAIRGLNGDGAPGPDGLPVFFYRDCQDVIGTEVMTPVELFRGGELNMDRINRSRIVLILKSQGAMDIGDFRPISLSNSLYLILAKLLENWLQDSIDALISPFSVSIHPRSTNGRQCGTCRRDCCYLKAQGHHNFLMESRLRQGIQLPRLAILMDCALGGGVF